MSATNVKGARAEVNYRPLDISKNEIHLLSFENTTPKTPIRLSLHYVSLNDYHLSHAWGDCEEEKAIILLDDVETAVTKNLEGALQDLRSSVECQLDMKMWIDALSIDQADIDDRNKHVLRVKDIFGGSFCVTASVKDKGSRDDRRPMSQLLTSTGQGLRPSKDFPFVCSKCHGNRLQPRDRGDPCRVLFSGPRMAIYLEYQWHVVHTSMLIPQPLVNFNIRYLGMFLNSRAM